MLYLLIENLSRRIMEWAMRRQGINRNIVDLIKDEYSYNKMKIQRVKKALS